MAIVAGDSQSVRQSIVIGVWPGLCTVIETILNTTHATCARGRNCCMVADDIGNSDIVGEDKGNDVYDGTDGEADHDEDDDGDDEWRER